MKYAIIIPKKTEVIGLLVVGIIEVIPSEIDDSVFVSGKEVDIGRLEIDDIDSELFGGEDVSEGIELDGIEFGDVYFK